MLEPGAALAPALVESEVREQVRRRGMDPAAEPALMRLLVEQVLGDYEQRALVEDLPVLGDRLLAARLVFDAVAGFGPLQAYLDDPVVEEIWINERLSSRSPCGHVLRLGLDLPGAWKGGCESSCSAAPCRFC